MSLIKDLIFISFLRYVSTEWTSASNKKDIPVDNIVAEVEDVTLLSCQLKCQNSVHCASIGMVEKMQLGKVAKCYHLRADLGNSSANQKPVISLFVWSKIEIPTIDVCGTVDDHKYKNCTRNIAEHKAVNGYKKFELPIEMLTDGNVMRYFTTECVADESWILIDLGKIAMVEKIFVYQSRHKDRLKNVKFEVLDDISTSEHCGSINPDHEYVGKFQRSYYLVICTKMIKGQYVKGSVYDEEANSCFTAAEVEVYGYFI